MMFSQELTSSLTLQTDARVVLFVLDGLGGLPHPKLGLTELEAARTPNLDELASNGVTGLSVPVVPGVSPGSGPGHLALFGYDPVSSNIGRGALSALGIGFNLNSSDLAVRLNFCTLDDSNNVIDRRAGRISTEHNKQLIKELSGIVIDNGKIELATESQHRAVLVLRDGDFCADVQETDPQQTGVPPLRPEPLCKDAESTSVALCQFLQGVEDLIGDMTPANFVLMRGYSGLPDLKPMGDLYKISPACAAAYPMYRGLAKAAGMAVLEAGDTLIDGVNTICSKWTDHDFFFLHYKDPDARGEDGDFDGKVASIEQADSVIPDIMNMCPSAIVITGDHSTPANLGQHSWHPVPFLISSKWCVPDNVSGFGERSCMSGGLGTFSATDTMRLLLSHAGRMKKFGA
tara:strand:- start:529 stop:1737 length:1209 start_codon:yes stop_codon:yes gene_type:complete